MSGYAGTINAAWKTITDADEEDLVQSSPLSSEIKSSCHQKSIKSNHLALNQQKLDLL